MITDRHVFKLLALLALASILASCDESPSYFGMLHRSKRYYLTLAEACNAMLPKTNNIQSIQSFNGNDPSLPKLVRELHANRVRIENDTNDFNRVGIIFGQGRPYYIIWWGRSDYGIGARPWQLSVAGEEVGKVVFSTTNLSMFDTNSAY
jgi:hypothetical protein